MTALAKVVVELMVHTGARDRKRSLGVTVSFNMQKKTEEPHKVSGTVLHLGARDVLVEVGSK